MVREKFGDALLQLRSNQEQAGLGAARVHAGGRERCRHGDRAAAGGDGEGVEAADERALVLPAECGGLDAAPRRAVDGRGARCGVPATTAMREGGR